MQIDVGAHYRAPQINRAPPATVILFNQEFKLIAECGLTRQITQINDDVWGTSPS